MKDFVPYEVALRLKAIGFAESCCFGYWEIAEKERIRINEYSIGNWNNHPNRASAPLYQQVFRWFRENGYCSPSYIPLTIARFLSINDMGYEEAELACLEKLLEIVESKSE